MNSTLFRFMSKLSSHERAKNFLYDEIEEEFNLEDLEEKEGEEAKHRESVSRKDSWNFEDVMPSEEPPQ